MDHIFGSTILVPFLWMTIIFLIIARRLQVLSNNPANLVGAAQSAGRDPPILIAKWPFDVVRQLVIDQLPQFYYCGGHWQLLDIQDGEVTTIAANLPCLDESDPDNVVRLDVGLIVKIEYDDSHRTNPRVKMHFILYEGLDSALAEVSAGTYAHMQKALGLTVDSPIVDALSSNGRGRNTALADDQDMAPIPVPTEDWPPPAVPDQPSFPASFPQAVPELFSGAVPEPAPVTQPRPVPVPLPEPVPVPLPAAFAMQPAQPLPAPPVAPAAEPEAGSNASLCPGCSQPINAAFPFCLYCGKNF